MRFFIREYHEIIHSHPELKVSTIIRKIQRKIKLVYCNFRTMYLHWSLKKRMFRIFFFLNPIIFRRIIGTFYLKKIMNTKWTGAKSAMIRRIKQWFLEWWVVMLYETSFIHISKLLRCRKHRMIS